MQHALQLQIVFDNPGDWSPTGVVCHVLCHCESVASLFAKCKTVNVFYVARGKYLSLVVNAVVAKQMYMMSDTKEYLFLSLIIFVQLESEFTLVHVLKFSCKFDNFDIGKSKSACFYYRYCWCYVSFKMFLYHKSQLHYTNMLCHHCSSVFINAWSMCLCVFVFYAGFWMTVMAMVGMMEGKLL